MAEVVHPATNFIQSTARPFSPAESTPRTFSNTFSNTRLLQVRQERAQAAVEEVARREARRARRPRHKTRAIPRAPEGDKEDDGSNAKTGPG